MDRLPTQQAFGLITHDEFYRGARRHDAIQETVPRRRERRMNSIAYLSRTNQCLAPCNFPMLISHKKSLDRCPSACRRMFSRQCCVRDLCSPARAIYCNTPTSSCAQFFVSSTYLYLVCRKDAHVFALTIRKRRTVSTCAKASLAIPRQDVLSA
jgi:hypothetical protein